MADKYDDAVEEILLRYRLNKKDGELEEFASWLNKIWNHPSEYDEDGGLLFQYVERDGFGGTGIPDVFPLHRESCTQCGCLTQVAYCEEGIQGSQELMADIQSEEAFNIDVSSLSDGHGLWDEKFYEIFASEDNLRAWLNKFAEFQRRIDKEVRDVEA